MPQKVLITGGAGFIARSLSEDLIRDYEVHTLTRAQLNLLDADQVSACIKNHQFDVVIHAATYDAAPINTTKDPSKVLEMNLRMFFNLARCHHDFGKLIYFGSGAEFGRAYWKPKMAENYFDQHVPTDQYGLSKYIMTQHALRSSNIYNLRIFGLFGKYDDWRYRVIPAACAKAVLGLSLTVTQNKAYDFLYIEQLHQVVRWVLGTKPQQQVYNVCTGCSNTFVDIMHKVKAISGSDAPVLVKSDAVVLEYSGDNRRLLSEFTDLRIPSIDEGIADLYDWYKSRKELLNPHEFHY